MDLKSVLDLVALLFIGGSFLLAAWTFHKNTRVRRAEWLLRLYEKFYERPELKQVRERLDYDKDALLRGLRNSDKATLESFSDYLNFFEFLFSLRKLGQIKDDEVREMFDYYIDLLRDPDIRRFCEEQGFENSLGLMKEFPPRQTAHA